MSRAVFRDGRMMLAGGGQLQTEVCQDPECGCGDPGACCGQPMLCRPIARSGPSRVVVPVRVGGDWSLWKKRTDLAFGSSVEVMVRPPADLDAEWAPFGGSPALDCTFTGQKVFYGDVVRASGVDHRAWYAADLCTRPMPVTVVSRCFDGVVSGGTGRGALTLPGAQLLDSSSGFRLVMAADSTPPGALTGTSVVLQGGRSATSLSVGAALRSQAAPVAVYPTGPPTSSLNITEVSTSPSGCITRAAVAWTLEAVWRVGGTTGILHELDFRGHAWIEILWGSCPGDSAGDVAGDGASSSGEGILNRLPAGAVPESMRAGANFGCAGCGG